MPVLRVFLKSAKGTKPCRRSTEEPVYRGGLGVPVLRVFLKSDSILVEHDPGATIAGCTGNHVLTACK